MFYLFVFLFLSFCSLFFYYHPNNRNYNNIKGIVFIILVCIVGLRYETGIDYFAYRQGYINGPNLLELFKYKSFSNYIEDNTWEPGFVLLSSIFRLFTDEVQLFFLFVSFFTTSLLFRSVSFFVEKKIFFFSLLSYFCFIYMFLEMQAVRQALAASIIFYGLTKLSEKGIKPFFKYIFLASLFHYSALILFPICFLLKKDWSKYFYIIILSVCFIIFILRIRWFATIISFLAGIFSDFYIIERIYNYTINDALNVEREFFVTIFLYIIVFLLLLFFKKNQKESDIIIKNLFFFFLIFTMILWELNILGVRITWYLLFGFVITLSSCLNLFSRSSKPIYICYILFFNFLIIRPFVFGHRDVISFTPYQDYITYKVFNRKSTGLERVNIYARDHYLPYITE